MANVFKVLAQVDRRVWYFLLFVLVSYPLLRPIGLPLKVGDATIAAYKVVENLKPGDIVIINYDVSAFGWDEVKGTCESLVPHIFQKPVKVILMTDQDQGYLFIQRTIEKAGKPMAGKTGFPWYEVNGKKYLEDYINIGYFPGMDKAVAALGADFRSNVGSKDFYGNAIDQWLDSNGVQSAKDIDLVVTIDCAGAQSWWVNYWYLPYKTPILNAMISVSAPGSTVNYNAGMLVGIIVSTRGAAEYQYLSKYYGMALVSMDAFSVVQIFLIVVIILGNIGYWGWERHQKRK